MNTNDYYRRWAEERRREDIACGFTKSWRVIVDGMVIAQTPVRHGDDFAKRMCEHFCGHIVSAFAALKNGTPWVWNGTPNGMQAQEWIRHHEKRLGMRLSPNVEVVGPGQVYPLAPNREAI